MADASSPDTGRTPRRHVFRYLAVSVFALAAIAFLLLLMARPGSYRLPGAGDPYDAGVDAPAT